MIHPPWTDVEFRRGLDTGHKFERYTAEYLRLHGLHVDLLDNAYVEHQYNGTHRPDVDLSCEGVLIEVKSRNISFISPTTYPYQDVIVDPVKKWDSKPIKAHVIIVVSQITKALIVCNTATFSRWTTKKIFDRVKRFPVKNYHVPRSCWHPISDLIEWLKRRAQTS